MMIDKGIPTRQFEDVIESHGEHIDFVPMSKQLR